MNLIIGLGNPGAQYKKTRHNVGFMVVDRLYETCGTQCETWKKKFNSEIVRCCMFHVSCFIIKPQTYMNQSGQTVAKIAHFYKINPSNIWVIHDDIDLAFGKLRVRKNGSSGGHNGMESIITSLNTSTLVRFRIGVGPLPE